ncbi:MAG: tRNA threonylcarbamoyladenosine dehydratase [Oscillospiraceae bacterium]
MEQFNRTEMLLGKDGVSRLQGATVAVFGVGGVGGYAVEALARGGIGKLILYDNDVVSISNINRQIIATHDTVGQLKVDVCRNRALSINPEIIVNANAQFITEQNAAELDMRGWDYIIDAIDTVSAKLALVKAANENNVPIISAMGAANKLDATAFCVTDIFKTEMDPLARVMRRELRISGIKSLKVVYSKEQALKPAQTDEKLPQGKRSIPGSVSYVPGVEGLILAGEVIKAIALQ